MHDDATRDTEREAPVVGAASGQDKTPESPESDSLAQRRVNRRRLMFASAATGVAATAMAVPGLRAQEATPSGGPATAQEAATQVATVTGEQPMTEGGHVGGGFAHFVPFQAAIVEAAAARLVPTDDLGPGATEAGVVYFIDRQLAKEHEGFRGPIYNQGPFLAGKATQGDQSMLSMPHRFRIGILGMEHYARQVYGGRGFAQLDPDEQDRILRDMEDGTADLFSATLTAPPAEQQTPPFDPSAQSGITAKAFFELLLSYTIAGFFADPVHGGNRDMVGWKMIGFPGAQMGYRDWILRYGEPYTGGYKSLAEHQAEMSGGA
ncbi:MAG: gluconate 2-dehydrogenase subunit 3 family protein [Thermomicrobiales bacterium]|nr:gluconate 2-dehydrogenase subunit 3 family protein [Thermomicrobiales bacterium]